LAVDGVSGLVYTGIQGGMKRIGLDMAAKRKFLALLGIEPIPSSQ